jgi:hypothetical protein
VNNYSESDQKQKVGSFQGFFSFFFLGVSLHKLRTEVRIKSDSPLLFSQHEEWNVVENGGLGANMFIVPNFIF